MGRATRGINNVELLGLGRYLTLAQPCNVKMEVTRDNFKQLVPYILSSIQECTFIAIDGEYSGTDAVEICISASYAAAL